MQIEVHECEVCGDHAAETADLSDGGMEVPRRGHLSQNV